MQSVRNLPKREFREFVKMLAHGFAAEWYKHRQGVDDDTAWLYAASFWQAHVDQVLDFLALSEALAEQENPERN
jgi:hypothetical protein